MIQIKLYLKGNIKIIAQFPRHENLVRVCIVQNNKIVSSGDIWIM